MRKRSDWELRINELYIRVQVNYVIKNVAAVKLIAGDLRLI